MDISVDFVSPEDLRIFNAGLKLDELPRSWAHYALTLEPVNPPVLVTQIRLGEGEWLYIASLLPEPYTSLEAERLPRQQMWFIALTSGFCCCSSACWCTGRAGRSSAWRGRRGSCRWAPRWSRWPRRRQ
jgi:hypothetical protein